MRAFYAVGVAIFGLVLTTPSPGVAKPSSTAFGVRMPVTQGKLTRAEGPRRSSNYKVLHSFHGFDGSGPFAPLLDVNGTLYGTTLDGGGGGCVHGCGTVFAITPKGAETVLHHFSSSGDGNHPDAGLINVNGTLYGTTYYGGANARGTAFAITSSGTETVLHSFGGLGDGASPAAGAIELNGILYGTTYQGGADGSADCIENNYNIGCGTVFAITPSGIETVLYRFSDPDGALPYAGLIDVSGTLYGTTHNGGANGYGTVFAITPSGEETVLHSFGSPGDGSEPQAGLIDVKGILYGTTALGGANAAGTVFAITPSGTETVLHSFGGSGDGALPESALLNVNGTLYGTTVYGGTAGSNGTAFAITLSGTESVLHSFGGSGDGVYPVAGLIDVNGKLYGTTINGGANFVGTVFELTP